MSLIFRISAPFILGICSLSMNAQKIGLSMQLRYESFELREIKEFHTLSSKSWPVKLELNDNLASSANYSISLEYNPFANLSLLASVGFGQTGNQYSYEDYSGQIVSRYMMKKTDITVSGMYIVIPRKLLSPVFETGLGVNITSLDINNSYQVFDVSQSNQNKFSSTPFFVKVGIGPRMEFKRLIMRLIVGYEFTGSSKLSWKEDKDLYLQHQNGQQVNADWSGLRTNLSIGFYLINKDEFL